MMPSIRIVLPEVRLTQFVSVLALTLFGPTAMAFAARVTSLEDSGPGTLRDALAAAVDHETITFDVSGTIYPQTGLVLETGKYLRILGEGRITLDGSQAAAGTSGLTIKTQGNLVQGLTIVSFPANGVLLQEPGVGNVFLGCRIGTSGATAHPNGVESPSEYAGILATDNACRTTLGDGTASGRNIVSGNAGDGIRFATSGNFENVMLGNYVGVAEDGATPLPNGGDGIEFADGARNTDIGGALTGASNLVQYNGGHGIRITSGSHAIKVLGNTIAENGESGVWVGYRVRDVRIGGDTSAETNLLRSNGSHGIEVVGDAEFIDAAINVFEGNGGLGIASLSAGNALAPPSLLCSDPVAGSAPCGSIVRLYVDQDGEGIRYLDSVVANKEGQFAYAWPEDLDPATAVVATAMGGDPAVVSEFSAAVSLGTLKSLGGCVVPKVVDCPGLYVDAVAPGGGYMASAPLAIDFEITAHFDRPDTMFIVALEFEVPTGWGFLRQTDGPRFEGGDRYNGMLEFVYINAFGENISGSFLVSVPSWASGPAEIRYRSYYRLMSGSDTSQRVSPWQELSLLPAAEVHHDSDYAPGDRKVNLSELLRLVQLYSTGGYGVNPASEDTFAPASGLQSGAPHTADCGPRNWRVDLNELLRVIQIYNSGGYHYCPDGTTEDGFMPLP